MVIQRMSMYKRYQFRKCLNVHHLVRYEEIELFCVNNSKLPRSVDVMMDYDLVDKVKPGDRVRVGID